MNHRPFEDWLLDEIHLSPDQRQELEQHLRVCRRCSSLSASGAELRLAKMVPPRAGFVTRFSHRLALQRAADRRRRRWGAAVLVAVGLAVLVAWAVPYVAAIGGSPISWITRSIGYFMFVISSGRALLEFSQVVLRLAPSLVPPYVWMMLVSATAGLTLVWAVSIWQVARRARGVRA